MKKQVSKKELFSARDKAHRSLWNHIGAPGDLLVIISSFVPEDHESIGILLVNDSPIENDKTENNKTYDSMTSRVLIDGVPRMINNYFIFPIDIDA
jgi:hypothetical protein